MVLYTNEQSTNVSDTAQLAVFVREIDMEFSITVELDALLPMKGTTRGADLYE